MTTTTTAIATIPATAKNAFLDKLVANRDEKKPLSVPADACKASKEGFKIYVAMIDDIQNKASTVVSLSISDVASPDASVCFKNGLKKSIAILWQSIALAPRSDSELNNDVDMTLSIVGTVKVDRDTMKRTFVPAAKNTFRKQLETLIAIRAEGETPEAKEARDARRKARNKAKNEAKKAAKQA